MAPSSRAPVLGISVLAAVALLAVFPSGLPGPFSAKPAPAGGIATHGRGPTTSIARPAAPRPATVVTPTNPSWGKLCSGSSPFTCVPQPSARVGPAAIYDAADHYTLLFGGGTTAAGGFQNDSWKFLNGQWTKLANGPSTLVPRSNASLAYDAADGYVLMWGGYTGANAYSVQTWKFLAGSWTLLSPASSPVGVIPACFVYVPLVTSHGGFVLLEGGKGVGTSYQSFTWEFSAGSWTNDTASVGTAPSNRGYSACTYDAADGYVVLFGGVATGGTSLLSDTFEFNPQSSSTGAWSTLSPSSHPEARFMATLTYVTALGSSYLACGSSGTLATRSPQGSGYGCTVWQWAAGSWTNVTTTFGFGTGAGGAFPKPGYDAAAADIPTASYAMRFGGFVAATSNTSNALGSILGEAVGASNGETSVGAPVTLYANGSFGDAPYSVTWSSLPTGCSSTNVSALVCTPSAAGTFATVTAVVSGTDGYNVSKTLPIVVDASGSVVGQLTLGSYVGKVGQNFWGVDLTPLTLNQSTLSQVAASLNATPFRTLRYGTSADAQNASNLSLGPLGVVYSNNGVGSASINNYSLFRTLCKWLNCTSIVTVPAQPNDPGLVAQTVSRIETFAGLHPTYWNIGNEPTGWTHFNIGETHWSSSNNVAPTATQYVSLVANDTRAILSVDPSAKIVGLTNAAGGGANAPFPASTFQSLAGGSGTSLVALDFHTYSATGETLKTPNYALSPTNTEAAPTTYATELAAARAGCSTCNLSITVGEYNTGGAGSTFPGTYVSSVAAAANAAQLLNLGATQFSYYSLLDTANLGLINATGYVARGGLATFASVLSRLPMGRIFNVSFTAPMYGLFGIESSTTGSATAFLLVNANTSVASVLELGSSFFQTSPTIYQATPAGVATPVVATLNRLGNLTLPAESVTVLVFGSLPAANLSDPPATSAGLFAGSFIGVPSIVWFVAPGILGGIGVVVELSRASRRSYRTRG